MPCRSDVEERSDEKILTVIEVFRAIRFVKLYDKTDFKCLVIKFILKK